MVTVLSIFWAARAAHTAWTHKVSSSLHAVWLLTECLSLIPVWRAGMGPVEVTQSQCNPSASVTLPIALSSLSTTQGVCMASAQRTPPADSLPSPCCVPPVGRASGLLAPGSLWLCLSFASQVIHPALSLAVSQGFTTVHIALTLGRISAEISPCFVTNLGQISSIHLQE